MGVSVQGIIGATTAGTTILNAFLVAVQKLNYDVQGDDGVRFLFAYRGQDKLELRSEITDHFLEDNTAVQDQWAVKPIRITIHGFIGELSDQPEGEVTGLTGALQEINQIASQLTVLGPYAPQLTAMAQADFNTAQQALNAFSSAGSTIIQLFNLATGGDNLSAQAKAFGYFQSYVNDRVLCQVQTPWGIYDNMALESCVPTQDDDNQQITDFELTFKQINVASTSLISNLTQGRLSAMTSATVNNGIANTTAAPSMSSVLGGASVFG